MGLGRQPRTHSASAGRHWPQSGPGRYLGLPAPPALTEPPERTLLRGGGDLVLASTDVKIVASPRPVPPIMLQGPCGFRAGQAVTLRANPMPVTAQFEIPASNPGEVFEFDIVQSLPAGQVVGGLRVVVTTMPELS